MDSVTSSPAVKTSCCPFHSAGLLFEGLEIGLFTVEGKDAEDFLHRQLCNEIRNLAVERGIPVCLLNREGHIQVYFSLWKTETGFSAVIPGSQQSQFIPLLDRVLFRDEVHLSEQTPDYGCLFLAGASARAILEKTGATHIPSEAYQSTQSDSGTGPLRIYQMDWLEWPGFVLVYSREQGTRLIKHLESAGAIPASLDCFHTYRIEKGSPWPGYEVDDSMTPYECGLEGTISFTKGCYVGQEIISRIHTLGKPPRVLRGLVIEGETPPGRGTTVFHEQVEVGRVLSAAWPETQPHPIATTSIRVKYSSEGTPLTVMGQPAVVRLFPLSQKPAPS